MREALDALVPSAGWRTETFASAPEFLARPRSLVPSCLMLDVGLPDLYNRELQQRIAADRMAMPIIFITGHHDVPMTVRAIKARAVAFSTKPFDGERPLSAIAGAIECGRA